MSESRPITTPPRRRNNLLAHVQHVFNSGVVGAGSNSSSAAEASSASTSNGGEASTNGTIRKLESYHHALLESGCQSAKSSPLPHRRLDKLEGVIRDKPITPAISSMRRPFDCGAGDDTSGPSSRESSPAFLRKRLNSNGTAAGCMPSNVMDHRFINNHQESPMPYRRQMQHHHHHHHHHSANVADYKNAINKSSFRFDSGECKSMAQRRSSSPSPPPPLPMRKCYDSECCSAASLQPPVAMFRDMSPEYTDDGRFGGRNLAKCGNVPSPAKGRLGEPGIFASPARSVCSVRNAPSPTPADSNGFTTKSYAKYDCTDDINDDDDAVVQPHADQSIVSGWLKFRDNKRVSAVTFESNFPAFQISSLLFSKPNVVFLASRHRPFGRRIQNELHCIASIVL